MSDFNTAYMGISEGLTLSEVFDISPEQFIMQAHNPNNAIYVWYYDSVEKKLVGSFDKKSHEDDFFAGLDEEKLLRGRVFDCGDKTCLMIYGSKASYRKPSSEEIRDIYLKISDIIKQPIDYVMDEFGEDLSSVLESISEAEFGSVEWQDEQIAKIKQKVQKGEKLDKSEIAFIDIQIMHNQKLADELRAMGADYIGRN